MITLNEDVDDKVFDVGEEYALEQAIASACLEDVEEKPFFFITKELMKRLHRGRGEHLDIMYKGVRCYVSGQKDELDKQEKMSAEKRADYLAYKDKGLNTDQVNQLKKEAQEAR